MLKVKGGGGPFLVALFLMALASSLLLAATVSVPVFRTIGMFRLVAEVNGSTRRVEFGVWGYCISEERNSLQCTRQLGWILDADISGALQTSPRMNTVVAQIQTSMLVVYPMTAAISLLVFFLSVALYGAGRYAAARPTEEVWYPRRLRANFLCTSFATFMTIFTMIVHIELVVAVRRRSSNLEGGNPTLRVEWMNGLGLSIGAVLCYVLVLYIMRVIRKRKELRESQLLQTSASIQPPLYKKARGPETHVMTMMGVHN